MSCRVPEFESEGQRPRGQHPPRSRRLLVTFGIAAAILLVVGVVLVWHPWYEVVLPAGVKVVLTQDKAIAVKVSNRGPRAGTYAPAFAIDGTKQSPVSVNVPAFGSAAMALPLPASLGHGSHTLTIDEATMTFTALDPAAFRYGKVKVRPAMAGVRREIDVQVSVTNTGDVEGRVPAVLKVNGKRQKAKPETLAPNGSANLVYKVKWPTQGRVRLAVDTVHASVLVVKTSQPANGEVLRRTIDGGIGTLTIGNDTREDAMVLVTRPGAAQTILLAVYLHAKGEVTFTGIPDGAYFVNWDFGRDWSTYTKDFLKVFARKRYRAAIPFATSSWTTSSTSRSRVGRWIVPITRVQRHTHYTSWTVELGYAGSKEFPMADIPRRQWPHLPGAKGK